MRTRRVLIAVAGCLGCAAVAVATPSPSSPPLSESIDVRVVNVEVGVTDRDGNRVTGLGPGDFTLTVDGAPFPVEYFSEVRDGRTQALPEVPAGAEAAPAAGGAAERARPMSAAGGGTHYLVVVDDYFAIGAQRDLVLTALEHDLSRLGPEDRMAIVAYDGGRLTALSPWSGSQADLSGALDRARLRTAYGPERLAERSSFHNEEILRSLGDEGTALDLDSRSGQISAGVTAYGVTLLRQIQASAGAAAGAMRAFSDVPGRKVVLLLAGRWPYSVRSFLTGGAGLPRQELPEGDRVLRPLVDTANLLGYTIYPVDVPGPEGKSGADAEATQPSPPGSALSREIETEQSLLYLADETGGRALLDGKRTDALARVTEDTRTFYWLGFTPRWQGDDRPHRLGVELRRPGLHARARSGFLDLSRQAETSMRLESALLLGSQAGALPMRVEVGLPKRLRRGVVELPLTLELPADLLTALPIGQGYEAHLELRFAATDEGGATSQIPVLPLTLTSGAPPGPGQTLRHQMTIRLRGRADRLVVAAYDPLSNRMATAESSIGAPRR